MTEKSIAQELPDFEDPRVQAVYQRLVDPTDHPKDESQHWEGWIARRIVAALDTVQGHVVVTKTMEGEIVAVTRQDDEGRIMQLISETTHPRWEQKPAPPSTVLFDHLAGRGMHELRLDELPDYVMGIAGSPADQRAAVEWIVSELARKTNDEKLIAMKLDQLRKVQPYWQASDERIKRLMAQVGMPNSLSLMQAFKQLEMEIRLEAPAQADDSQTPADFAAWLIGSYKGTAIDQDTMARAIYEYNKECEEYAYPQTRTVPAQAEPMVPRAHLALYQQAINKIDDLIEYRPVTKEGIVCILDGLTEGLRALAAAKE